MNRDHAMGLTIFSILIGVGACRFKCVVADTLIRTPAGPKRIDQLRVGDAVCTWSSTEGGLVTRTVTEVHRGLSDHVYDLQLEDGHHVSLTGEHPVFCVEGGRWRRARELRAGEVLRVVDEAGVGREVAIRSILRMACDARPVFNLSVDTEETFLANGVWVHNKSPAWDSGRDSGLVDVPNAAPSAALDAPAVDAELTADTPLLIQARIDDAEDGPEGLAVAVESSLDGPLTVTDERLEVDGTWSGAVQLGEGSHRLRLTVTDTGGLSSFDEVTVVVGPASP